ncbi:MAG: phosphatidate cytidylyltransferase [Spirochaetia bacterium]|nr:phosphatidate cytidylyltransferase [Spirochaetia bacterium]
MNETLKRIISGLILAAFYIIAFNYDGIYSIFLYLFCLLFVWTGLSEFFTLYDIRLKIKPGRLNEKIFSIFLVTFFYIDFLNFFNINENILIGFFLFYLFILFISWIIKGDSAEASVKISGGLMAMLYIALPVSHLFLIKKLENGVFFIWLVSWATVMSDTMAYASGKLFGRTKVRLPISPNKTYEGYIGGLIGQLLLTYLFYAISKSYFDIIDLTLIEIIVIGLIIYIASIAGDLSESLLKRDSGLKDSGNTIPGHGGVLDLIDALLFTIPGFYYSYLFIEFVKRQF